MNQPLIKNTLLHFLEWRANKGYYLISDEVLIQLYFEENPIPNFTEFPELEKLWSDPKSDYDMGVRTGIKESWKVVKGEER